MMKNAVSDFNELRYHSGTVLFSTLSEVSTGCCAVGDRKSECDLLNWTCAGEISSWFLLEIGLTLGSSKLPLIALPTYPSL